MRFLLSVWNGVRSWAIDNFWFLLAICLCIVVFLATWHLARTDHSPPIGVYIAIMGAVAAAVTFRREPTPREKAAWIILLTLFLVAEIRNLYVADRKQIENFKTITNGLSAAVNGINETIRNSEQQFAATMTKENQVLGTTQQVADLAKKNLENITGGESFAVVTPQVWSGLVPIPLTIYNYGKQTLTGVTVTIRDRESWDFFRNPYSMYQAQASALDVGTLHAGEMKTLSRALTPSVEGQGAGILGEGKDKVCEYQLDIAAQNFTVTEYLTFKKGRHVPWNFRYTVLLRYIKAKTKKETRFGYKKLAETDWKGD